MRSRYILLITLALFSASCRKVISLDLNNAAKKLVVEANLTDDLNGCSVLLTKTGDFDADNNFPTVSGAVITITDDAGVVTKLTESSPGTYIAPSLQGKTGVTYHLLIAVGGDTIRSVSTMPVKVNFDKLSITSDQILGNDRKVANVFYTDPEDVGHYYQFVQWKNDVKVKQIYTADNELTAGKPQQVKLYIYGGGVEDKDRLQSGDNVQVEMQCLDEAAHKYWFSAQQSATGSNNNAVPTNPVSNLQGNALGYFSAHTSQIRIIKVP